MKVLRYRFSQRAAFTLLTKWYKRVIVGPESPALVGRPASLVRPGSESDLRIIRLELFRPMRICLSSNEDLSIGSSKKNVC